MKTKSLFICAILATLLLSACIPMQAPNPSQPLAPTPLPVTLPTPIDSPASYPMADQNNGPEVIQLGELTMEIYERILKAPNDDGSFTTTAGPSSEILKTRWPLRDIFSQPFSPPLLNGRQLTSQRTYVQNQSGDGITASFENVTVTFKLDDEEVLSVNCGAVSPVDPLRGMWVIGKDWYVEVAHVENEVTGNVVTTKAAGEIFMNGVSLNEQYGYDETFGFQPLDDTLFAFSQKTGRSSINYAGKTYQLGKAFHITPVAVPELTIPRHI